MSSAEPKMDRDSGPTRGGAGRSEPTTPSGPVPWLRRQGVRWRRARGRQAPIGASTGLKQAGLSLGTLAVAAGAFFLLRDHAVGVALAIALAALFAPILWLLVSALRPALPDRKCPKCQRDTLRLLIPGERVGARCPECGFSDTELYVPYLIDVDEDLDGKA